MAEFKSIPEFLAHLAVVAVEMREAEERGMERAAKIIEAEGKAEVGSYQDAAGPFAAWPQLAETTQREREAKGFTANDPLLRTGQLRDSIDHAVQGREAVVGSNADEAVYQELGTSRIPARSFLGGAAFRKGKEAAEAAGADVVAAMIGSRAGLARFGE